MSDALAREEYDAMCTDLTEAATDRIDEGDDPEEVLWDVVGDAVPRLTRPVSEAILDYSEYAPLDPLVEQVTADRDSDEAERRRAEAITVLLQEIDAAARADGYDGAGFV